MHRAFLNHLLGTLVVVSLMTAPAWAQSSASTWNDLPDRFEFTAGGYRIATNTSLTLGAVGGGGTPVDFEKDLNLPSISSTLWLETSWRIARRHQVKLDYTGLIRTGDPVALSRDITFGGQVFAAGVSAYGATGTHIFTGYYRFAAYRNDRFEIGPTVGLGYLWMNAGIHSTATVSGGGQSVSFPIVKAAASDSPTLDIGVYLKAWLARRVELRGDFLYIEVKPSNEKESVTDGGIGLNWYPWRKVGFGAQYKIYKFTADRSALSLELGGHLTLQGGQAYVSFLVP
jgi:hypothetical protein